MNCLTTKDLRKLGKVTEIYLSIYLSIYVSIKPGHVDFDRQTVNCIPISNQKCNDLHVFFPKYLIAIFHFSMLNDKKCNTYHYVD